MPFTAHELRTLAVFHLAEVSGPAKSLRPRLAALADRGELTILAPGHGSLGRTYAELGEIRALPYAALTVPRRAGEAASAVRRLGREVRLFRLALRRARPDLVVIVTTVLPAALLAARLEGLPTIAYVGEIFAKGHVEGRARTLGGRLVAGLSEALADRLVCCSRTVAGQFGRSSKAVTIYPGISTDHSGGAGEAFRTRFGLEGARPLVAVVGHVCAARGQDTAVRGLAALRRRHPDARLVIAGAAPRASDEAYAAGVRALARELGVEGSTAFAGFVERTADVYAAADVVINPARFNEPFGRVAPEALVAGRPVVASAVGAIPEVLRDGRDALLVPPDDPQALAGAVARLVEDPALSRRIVAEGGQRVRERFAEQAGVEAFERVVAEVIGERRRAA